MILKFARTTWMLCVGCSVVSICLQQVVTAAAKNEFPIGPAQSAEVVSRAVQLESIADSKSLRIVFDGSAQYPNALFSPKDGKPWNWAADGAMQFTVTNPAAEPTPFSVRIDDATDADGTLHCRTGSAVAPPKSTRTFIMEFGAGGDSLAVHGMRAGPPTIVGGLPLSGGGSVDASHITAFQIFMHHPGGQPILILDAIGLEPARSAAGLYDGIVDAFGQYTRADWPGKIHSDAELKASATTEAKDLAEHPTVPGRDEFGGWAAGPTFAPTGFFTTRQVNGKWWLVDPAGKLFFSVGPSDVAYQSWNTIVTGREAMFNWLPKPGDPLARFYGKLWSVHNGPITAGKTFNFYAANLDRKFGSDFKDAWRSETVARFKSWGFNTLGNWSDPDLEHTGRIPYAASLAVVGPHPRISGGSDYWSKMHDPFDPQFAADAETSFKRVATADAKDPWCLGYYIDNELSWSGGKSPDHGHWGLAYGALAAAPTSAARIKFIAILRAKYQTIDRFNAAWNWKAASWDSLALPADAMKTKPTAAMQQDLSDYLTAFAHQYFTVVRAALRKYDPNHLYLGCRFSNFTIEEAKAAAEVCDVVSFNVYRRGLTDAQWRFTRDLNKPCLIGEFHFGATDRGMFHPGLVAASTQAERAEMYEHYVESVEDQDAFVGCHWFEDVDEPLTGRSFDGENYNIGFVTVTDTPYAEMIAAARDVHGGMYERRFGEAKP